MSIIDDGSATPPTGDNQDWWSEGVPNARQQARYAGQVARLQAGLEADYQDRGVKLDIFPPGLEDLAGAQFLYSTDTLLVRRREGDQEDVDSLIAALGPHLGPDRRPRRLPGGTIPGLDVLVLDEDTRTPDERSGPGRQPSPVERALETVPEGLSGLVSYDRVVHVASHQPTAASACPASDPVEAYVHRQRPNPHVNPHSQGTRRVRVAVIDTGLRPLATPQSELDEHPWLRGVTGAPESGSATGEYRGHGMFVAGVLRTQAPDAEVIVYPLLFASGGRLESDLAPQVQAVFLTEPPFDIISMSAGTTFETVPDPGAAPVPVAPLPSFDTLRERFEHSETLFICAAGNNSNSGPFHPASDGWPVAVGALDLAGWRAGYSCYGPWVDVYARGSDIINAYPNGVTKLAHGNVTFSTGMAMWSGTSFSTPLVAGLVAARMSWSNERAKDAWAALFSIAQSKAHLGMNVLEPGDADRP